jgi:hypothetical protein
MSSIFGNTMDKFSSRPNKKQMDDLHRQITTGLRSTELAMGKEPSYDEEGNLLGRAVVVPGTLNKPHPKPESQTSDYFRSPTNADIRDNPITQKSDETRETNIKKAKQELIGNLPRNQNGTIMTDKNGLIIRPSYGDIGAAEFKLNQNNRRTVKPASPTGVQQPSQTQLPVDARFTQSNEFLERINRLLFFTY